MDAGRTLTCNTPFLYGEMMSWMEKVIDEIATERQLEAWKLKKMGCNQTQIGQVMRISQQAVSGLRRRLMKKLRRFLDENTL